MTNTIDISFNKEQINMLKSVINKKLYFAEHDKFLFSNASSQVVKLEFENESIYFYNFTEQLDYYGTLEDVAVLELSKKRYEFVDKKNMIKTLFNETIKSIDVVKENQQLFLNDKQIYDVYLTRGIIFNFEQYQFSLEKAVWFSEDIYVNKGYNLYEKFTSVNDFIDSDWEKGYKASCEREVVRIL